MPLVADRAPSLADLVVHVTIANDKLKATQDALRQAEGEWTTLSLAGSDAYEVAAQGLRLAWNLLNRFNDIGQDQLRALKEKK